LFQSVAHEVHVSSIKTSWRAGKADINEVSRIYLGFKKRRKNKDRKRVNLIKI